MSDVSSSTGRPLRPRRRILNAALELAIEGGYENLQVRALSERAGVSSRTIYAHFASLDSLLIVAVAEQSQDLYRRYTESPPSGRTAVARVTRLIADLTETMTTTRNLTVALMRGLLSGKPDVAPWVHDVRGRTAEHARIGDCPRRTDRSRSRGRRDTRRRLVLGDHRFGHRRRLRRARQRAPATSAVASW